MTSSKRTAFFEAGLELLGDGGYAHLKQATVCHRLGVTTGSFYHSFKSWKDYTEGLLEYWLEDRTRRLIEVARDAGPGLATINQLLLVTLDLPHQAEAAIRVWAAIDPDVALAQQAVDDARAAIVLDGFLEMGVPQDKASELAQLGLMTLVGYEQMSRDKDPALLERLLVLIRAAAEAAVA